MAIAGEQRRAVRTATLVSAKRSVRWAAHAFVTPTSGMRMLPDYLIVGAQRCGTTSLHRHLLQHPCVGRTLLGLKGMHYFSTNYRRGWRWYRTHFPTNAYRERVKRKSGHDLIVGEGSPYYIFHPLAAERIAERLPGVKLLVMLRDPVERAYSHYQHMLLEGLEGVATFEEAIEREPDRLAGEVEKILADPAYNSFHHQHHSYLARGIYVDQLRPFCSLFPEDQVLVLRSEDFSADPIPELEKALSFLGLPGFNFPEQLKRHNVGRYPQMNAATRERLVEHFAEHNQRLYDLLNVDLRWSR